MAVGAYAFPGSNVGEANQIARFSSSGFLGVQGP